MSKQGPDIPGGKTEEMLKREARERAAEQARIDALKKPAPPAKKKMDNFWYHYKFHTLAALFVLVLAAFFVKDMVFQVKPDLTVIMTTSRPVAQETLDALKRALEEAAWDFNGDGKVSVAVDYIYMPGELPEQEATGEQALLAGQQEYANVMKLTTVVAAGSDPLFLLDDEMYDYFQRMGASGEEVVQEAGGEGMFMSLASAGGTDGDRLPLSETWLGLDPDLEPLLHTSLSLRPSRARGGDYHAYCLELLQALSLEQG